MTDIDINALKKDLEKLKPIIQQDTIDALTKQKELCDEINNKKFDEVIHKMFTKNEIVKLLNKDSIPHNIVEKAILKKEVGKAIDDFKGSLLNKVQSLFTINEIIELFEKHGVKFDTDSNGKKTLAPGTDPKIIALFDSAIPNIGVSTSYGPKSWMLNITYHYSSVPNPITAFIKSDESFEDWAVEHFLVKDINADTFELVY
jgi:hypothetical protein